MSFWNIVDVYYATKHTAGYRTLILVVTQYSPGILVTYHIYMYYINQPNAIRK